MRYTKNAHKVYKILCTFGVSYLNYLFIDTYKQKKLLGFDKNKN